MSIRKAALNVGGGTRSTTTRPKYKAGAGPAVLVSAKAAENGGNVWDLAPLGRIPSCSGWAPHSL